jgi:hypothetical protein
MHGQWELGNLFFMANTVYEADVVALARTLLGLDFPEGNAVAYHPGTLTFSLLETEEFDELTIDVSGQTSSLREALASLDALQLAFDAAAVTVDYRFAYPVDQVDEEMVRDRLRRLAAEPTWELHILELNSEGSFRAKLRAVIKSPWPHRVLAVAILGAAVFAFFVPPVAGVVVAALGVVNEGVLPLAEFLANRMDPEQQDLAQQPQFLEALEAMNARLEELQRAQIQSLDLTRAQAAEIRELRLTIEAMKKE